MRHGDTPDDQSWANIAEMDAALGAFSDPLAAADVRLVIQLHIARQMARVRDLPAEPEHFATLVWAGRFRAALTAAHQITDPFARLNALRDLVAELARTQHFHQAAAVARLIEPPSWRRAALCTLAGELAQAGYGVKAAEIVHSLESVPWQTVALRQLVVLLAQRGQVTQALTMAHRLEAPGVRVEVLCALGGELQHQGDARGAATFEAARAAAQTISEYWPRADALKTIAEAQNPLAHSGARSDAPPSASIQNPHEKDNALRARVATHTHAGDFDAAERAMQAIERPWARALALCTLAEGLARVNEPRASAHFSAAEAIMRGFDSPRQQATGLWMVVAALARAGQRDAAGAIARTLAHPILRASALAQVGWFVEALNELKTCSPDEFVRMVLSWRSVFDQVAPGLAADVAADVARIMARA